jgi:hypothetical protein
VETWIYWSGVRNSSGSFAMFAAILRASSLLSNLAADLWPFWASANSGLLPDFTLDRELQRPGKDCFWVGGVGMKAVNHANRFSPSIRTETCGASQIANRNHDAVILAYRVPWAVVWVLGK